MANFEVIHPIKFFFFKKSRPFWILELFRESITIVLSKKSILRGSDILLVFSESPSYLRITRGTSLKFDITTSTSIVSFRSEKLEQKKNHNGLNSRVFFLSRIWLCRFNNSLFDAIFNGETFLIESSDQED